MKNVVCFFWVCWLLKVNYVMAWLEHKILLFQKHREHFPSIRGILFILFTMFSIMLLPMSSLRFLLHLKAVIGLFWIIFRDLLTDSMFHFFRIILLIYIYIYILMFRFTNVFLWSFSTVLMWLSNSSELYPSSRNCCLSSLQWCWKSFEFLQIRLIHSA